jgi:uncharacterized protein YndB with AHSA1/START domain
MAADHRYTLASLLILIVVIGALLPHKHRVSRTASVHASPETVWNLISGPPNWRMEITSYQELPSQNEHRIWRETDKHNQAIIYEAMESTPPRRLVTRIADPKLPFGGTWTYEITSTGASSTLTIMEDGRSITRSFVFSHASSWGTAQRSMHT